MMFGWDDEGPRAPSTPREDIRALAWALGRLAIGAGVVAFLVFRHA